MKSTILLCIAIAFLLFANQSKAQSFFTFVHIDDSSGVAHCSVPSTAVFNVTTWCSFDFAGQQVTIHVYFGDGNDTVVYGTMPGWDQLITQVPHTYTSAGAYYPHGIATLTNGWADTVYNGYPVMIKDSCHSISGNVYFDENQNCIYDGSDVELYTHLYVKSGTDTIAPIHSYNYGHYSYELPSTGNFTIELNDLSSLGLTPLCPASWDYNFTTDNGDVQLDFSLECSATEPDNQIQNAWITGALPGDNAYVTAILVNDNCFHGSGSLTFELDSLHQYLGVYVNGSNDSVPVSVNGNVITFDFDNLFNFLNSWNQYVESIQTLTNPNSLQGDSFCILVTITPNDLDTTNNVKHMCGVIGGSFDPNHKRVSPLGVGEQAIVPPLTELTYTIEFQNTGNAPATNVILRDTLDTDFDLSTLEVTGSSHPMTYALDQNALAFTFANIMLPDSGSDEAGSHGWVRYKIKPNSNAPLGTVVTNRTSIYFDNNAPVLTNTTKNTFDFATGVTSTSSSQSLFAFPNPASSEIQFSLPQNFHGEISIMNLFGNVVWSQQIQSSNFKLATDEFASGIYLVMARDGVQNYSCKFAVQR